MNKQEIVTLQLQGVTGEKFNILAGHSIGHSKQTFI